MVEQRPVGLVADGGDERDAAGGGGPDHGLVVEPPQVFERAAAARHDEHVGARQRVAGAERVEAPDGAGHLFGAAVPLHPHGPHQHAPGEPVRDAVQDVADDGAGRRGDDPDHARQERQGALAGGIEQSFGGEAAAPLLHHGHEGADAGGFERFDDDLVGGLARKGRDLAGRHHLHALFGLDAHARETRAPHDGIDAGALVLEGEIGVAGGMRSPVVRHLAPHPDVSEPLLDGALQRTGEFGDADFRGVRQAAALAGGGFVRRRAGRRVEDRGGGGPAAGARPSRRSECHGTGIARRRGGCRRSRRPRAGRRMARPLQRCAGGRRAPTTAGP